MRRAMFGMRMPYYRTATGYFDDQVAVAIRTIKRRHPDLLTKIECAVEDVPPSDPLAWEEYSASLSQSFPASHGVPARIALYRKPIEARAHHRIELQLIIREELVRQIAALTGMYPEDIDPSWNM